MTSRSIGGYLTAVFYCNLVIFPWADIAFADLQYDLLDFHRVRPMTVICCGDEVFVWSRGLWVFD
jgi:hypothetical protein